VHLATDTSDQFQARPAGWRSSRRQPGNVKRAAGLLQTEQTTTLVASLQDAARRLSRPPSLEDLEQTLELIVRAAVDTVAGVTAAGITIERDGQLGSHSPTGEAVRELERSRPASARARASPPSRRRRPTRWWWPTTSPSAATTGGGRGSAPTL